MPFTTAAMFPGDLYDNTDRLGSIEAPTWSRTPSDSGSARWQQMLELGWQGVLVDEAAGGVGATLADFAAIAEAAGRHAMVQPLTARCVVAPMLLAQAGGAAASALLEQVSAGAASVCPVIETNSARIVQAADSGGSRFTLKGVLRGADLTEPASHLMFHVLAGAPAAPMLVLLPTSAMPREVRYFAGIDGTRTADITLDGVVIDASQVLLQGPAVTRALEAAMATGAVMSCVQTVGALGAMIEQTIEYLSTRQQFGVALSTFQALRHRVVEMYVAYESARGLVKQVTSEMSAPMPSGAGEPRDAALTKLYVTKVGRMVAESTIQLHGGMGMTVEMPATRLAMHTLMRNLQYGTHLQCLDTLSAHMTAEVMATPA